jgi:hypothetical protein
MKKFKSVLFLLITATLLFHSSVLAQGYYFHLTTETVHAFWNEDGTLSLDYTFVFENSPSGHAIEFVDVGLPNSNFVESSITADVNGQPAAYVSRSEFEGTGVGVAVALGSNSIPPGQRGTVHVYIGTVRDVLYEDSDDDNYASGVFAPAHFVDEIVFGETNLSVTFHLPPGVQPDEPRWHKAPPGFPDEPETDIDDQGRIIYHWQNDNASAARQYFFGASFPKTYVPSSAIVTQGFLERLGIDPDVIIGFLCFGSVIGFIVLMAVIGVASSRKRKMKYLPPKIRIEGHGIKRGLTAVEAAVVMEQPMDKILTMILFAIVKKDAAQVVSRDPLKLEVKTPQPEGLHLYESRFLEAFKEESGRERQRELQNMLVQLIKSVGQKMKGFSHKETVVYYRDIMRKAWEQVEAADTPEVKSQKFDEYMGWTMLDKDFEDRTQEVFRTGPVIIPVWWGRYDPGWSPTRAASRPAPTSTGTGRSAPSLPNLPGGEFAASVVTGIQNFSSDVVGDITSFTSRITNKTNPIPKSTSKSSSWSSRGGGSSCACACACAGCACACAGGGR